MAVSPPSRVPGAGRWRVPGLALVVLLITAVGAAAAPSTLVYDGATLRALSAPPGGLGAGDGVVHPDTVHASALIDLPAEEMARVLRGEIDRARTPGRTHHVVAIDEIGNAFRDPRPDTDFRTVTVRGNTYRIASHNRIRVTPGGWRLVRNPPDPTPPGPEHPGSRLSRALAILAEQPSPWGGSYAERVHLLIAPAMVTAIGAGNGRHFTLDRSGGRAIRAAWRGVMPALATAGGVWLEMYHGGRRPLSARMWRTAPGRIASYVARHGGDPARVHLFLTSVTGPPAGIRRCGGPMSCQWAAARRSKRTRAVLANGVGAYRLDGDAGAWLAELRRSR